MALKKQIELKNGIILNYHRITSLNKITNQNNTIEVNSYINEAQRKKEKEYQDIQKKNAEGKELTVEEQEILDKGINVLVEADFITKEYNETETIEDTYKHLKTLDRYKEAEDI